MPSYRTPGGHRRFSSADIRAFLRQRHNRKPDASTSNAVDHALGLVRKELQDHSLSLSGWFRQANNIPSTRDRTRQREFGQDLLRTVVAFVEGPERRDALLDQGRATAREYGRNLAETGLSSANAARATIYFRQVVLKTVLSLDNRTNTNDLDASQFLRVSAFLDEILLAILDAYP